MLEFTSLSGSDFRAITDIIRTAITTGRTIAVITFGHITGATGIAISGIIPIIITGPDLRDSHTGLVHKPLSNQPNIFSGNSLTDSLPR
jgi:hypothetical protein